jgi:hypothetical protein
MPREARHFSESKDFRCRPIASAIPGILLCIQGAANLAAMCHAIDQALARPLQAVMTGREAR